MEIDCANGWVFRPLFFTMQNGHHDLKSDLAKIESVKLLLSQLPQSLQSCVAETNLEVILSLREYQNSECLAASVAKVNQKPIK